MLTMPSDWVFLTTAGIAGAVIGSFLNVVIFRGAAMWGLVGSVEYVRGDFIAPRSYCPKCRVQIAIYDLVPLVSYWALRGKCRACKARISITYPIIEAAAACAAVASILAFGLTIAAALSASALFLLIAIAEIDRLTTYVPDALSIPFLWLGLLANLDGHFAPLRDSVIGAVTAYAAFTIIGTAYRRLRGREGLGDGDAVLLAGIGAWCGWQVLPIVVFIAAAATLGAVASRRLLGRPVALTDAIPFGPGLCLGGAIALVAARAPWNPFAL